jgi:hypothetical protein
MTALRRLTVGFFDRGLLGSLAVATAGAVVVGLTRPSLQAPGVIRGLGIVACVLTLVELVPIESFDGVGVLIAKGAVVTALLLGQLEVGQGQHYLHEGVEWLFVGLGLALQAFWLHLIQRSRCRQRASQREAFETQKEQARHDELLATVARSAGPHRVSRQAALVLTGLILVWSGSRLARPSQSSRP